ncbi:Major actin [Bulinus truncatus]|nr:Major actin [Bulinus truncatus]
MSDSDEVLPIVVDNGSDSCKVGIAREDLPASVVPTVLARKASLVGQKALDRVADLELQCPINRGLITNWDDIESVWSFLFKDVLKADTSKHPVMMSEPLNNPASNREKTAQIMFEKFQVPAFYIANQAVLSLYHAGRVTGTVVDVGGGVTSVVPIFEGFSIGEAAVKMDLAGSDVTEYLIKLLADKGTNLTSPANKLTANQIKEKLCFVAQQQQATSAPPSTFELPDKRTITLETERHACAEVLFNPGLLGRGDLRGLHTAIQGAISACDMNTRKPLYTNVLLSGGTSLLEGLNTRLQGELSALAPQNLQAKVQARRDRHLAAWIGGSVYATLPTFRQMQITKREYEETGPSIIQRKCP